MRRIEREDLTPEYLIELQTLQEEVDSRREQEDFIPGEHWDRRRKSTPILAAFSVLKRMAGARERCMYCVDSEASDIEHFWPKSPHPERLFVWENLLIACTKCGRFKGKQFPRTDDGSPLLIDPVTENPWEFLDFDPDTGNIVARYLLASESYSKKGETTVAILHLDKREGVSAGYRKTYLRLLQLVEGWTNEDIAEDFIERLRDMDDHGLLGWVVHGSGQNEPWLSRFRERYPDAWIACLESFE
jgi:uncharacterized protein (TIGR02646 family)